MKTQIDLNKELRAKNSAAYRDCGELIMKRTTSTPKMTSPLMIASAIHAPQWPRHFEQVLQRAEAFYAARHGMIGMTLNDWLKAEQELKPKFEKQITYK